MTPSRCPGDPGDIDPIVSLLYDGIDCPGDWYDALDAIRVVLDADSFHLFTLRREDASVLPAALTNVDVPDARPLARLSEMTRALPVGAFVAGAYGIGACPMLAMSLRADESTREVLGFLRSGSDRGYGPASLALCGQWAPHLVRAGELRARMQQLVGHAAIGLSTLDGLSQGMAVIDEDCRVQYLNRAGQARVTGDGPCRIEQGRLLPASGLHQPAFRKLVRNACAASGAPASGASRARATALPSGLSVLPLKASHPLASFRHRHLALVVFASPAAACDTDPRVLGELLGLTPTEAGLALLLSAGKTLKDFADVRQCSTHTARSHLKRLLQKTGCHRQMELVQLVQSMRPVWSAGPAEAARAA
jgi:DNA-binding CsgD family transcriptional regulator